MTILIALAVLLSTSCSSSTETAGTTTSSPSVTSQTTVPATTSTSIPDLEAAVRAYTTSYLGGDATSARSLLSQRCQAAIAETDFTAAVTQASAIYGDATITGYSEQVDGAIATATYELSDPSLNQTAERWVLEAREWRNDDC